jgi:hypothetical protein
MKVSLCFTLPEISNRAVNLMKKSFLKKYMTIPSAENGVIVRNLNYRPWQWVYSISGCKSFPGCF